MKFIFGFAGAAAITGLTYVATILSNRRKDLRADYNDYRIACRKFNLKPMSFETFKDTHRNVH